MTRKQRKAQMAQTLLEVNLIDQWHMRDVIFYTKRVNITNKKEIARLVETLSYKGVDLKPKV